MPTELVPNTAGAGTFYFRQTVTDVNSRSDVEFYLEWSLSGRCLSADLVSLVRHID